MTGILIGTGIYFVSCGIFGISLGIISRNDYKIKSRYAVFIAFLILLFILSATCFIAAFD